MHLKIYGTVHQNILVVAKVIANMSLYVKINLTTSVISMFKKENNKFLSEYIRDWLSSYEKNN